MAMGNYDYVSGVDTLTKVSENENVSLQKVLDSDNRYDPIRANVLSTVDNMDIPTYNTSFGKNYEGETRGGLPAATDTNKGEAKIAGVNIADDGTGMAYYKIDGMDKTTYQVPVTQNENGGFDVAGAFTNVKDNEQVDADNAMKTMTPASELTKGTTVASPNQDEESSSSQQTPDNQRDNAGGTQAATNPSSAVTPTTTSDAEVDADNTGPSTTEKKENTPEASPQNEKSLEKPKGVGTASVNPTPGFSGERKTQDTSNVKAQKESDTDPKSRDAGITQQQAVGNTQTQGLANPSASAANTNQAIEEQNMMDDFIARGAEKVSSLDSVAAENDLEITQNDSGMNVIDIASAPNGEVTIGGAMYTLVGDRTDDTGESIGQLFYDKTSDNYTSVEYGKVVNWGDTNPNKQV
tara:strand:+ start:1 stop:1227 length:1227 start_codon:yes stop_codon:yes gene_type:complete